jgi:hypothetical protein
MHADRKPKILKLYQKCKTMQKDAKRNAAKICLQSEAKIMQNGLCFASISYGSERKIQAKRDTLCGTSTFFQLVCG